MADSQASGDGRRSALQRIGGLVVGGLGAALGVGLIAPAVIAAADPIWPLRRRRRQAADESGAQPSRVKVAEVAEIPNLDQGAPPLRAAVVVSGLRDAWNRLDSTRLGSVFLGTQKGALTCL